MTLVLALVFVLVGGVTTAQAAKGIVGVVGAFTEQSGSGAGEFTSPAGVAVSPTSGDVYVADAGNERVQQFDADGIFIRAWGWDVVAPDSPGDDTTDPVNEFEVCEAADGDVCQIGAAGYGAGQFSFFGESAGIAVGPDGSVYVADTGNQRIQKFTADGAFLYAFGFDVDAPDDPENPGDPTFEVCTTDCQFGSQGGEPGQFSNPIAVAVDPANGDVLVADRDNVRIQRFDDTGAYLSEFSTENSIAPHRVAVDATGSIYVLAQGSEVQRYDSTGTFVEVLGAGIDPNPLSGPEELAAAGDRVYVSQVDQIIQPARYEVLEFDPALPAGDQLVDRHRVDSGTPEAVLGLGAHPSNGRVYINLRVQNAQGTISFPRIFILDEGGVPPATVTLLPASDVGARAATLNAEINSNGGLPTDYQMQISPDGINWTTVDTGSVPGGITDVAVTGDASGLRPKTLYGFRIITNKGFNSPDAISSEITFLTDPAPPDILESKAASVTATSATLQGRINPNSSETSYRFDYGIGAFNRSIPIPAAPIGSGPDAVFVSQALQGLQANTTYQLRLVATSTAGTTTGPTRTFTTTPAPPDDRAYELVSPADKVSGVGVGRWYTGLAVAGDIGYAARERERFAIHGNEGNPLVNGAYAYADDHALAERTPEGWTSKPGISRRAHGPQLLTLLILWATNEDLSLTSYSSNGHINRLFPEMEFWDEGSGGREVKTLRDWTTGTWEVFAATDPQQVVHESGVTLAGGPTAVAADGSAVVASGRGTRGLAGPGDPTGRDPSTGLLWPDRETGSSIYLDEVTGPFSDVFPGDDGVRELVNVCTGTGDERTRLPSGPCPDPLPGRDARLISPGGAALAINETDASRVMSDDGTRVFFMSPDPEGDGVDLDDVQLYVRQRNSDNSVVTRWISETEVEGQAASLRSAARFEGASRDGDKVFFRTRAPLTADDPNGGGVAPPGGVVSGLADEQSSDLYMYDMPDDPDADPADGDLVRVSAGPDGGGDCNSSLEFGDKNSAGDGALRFVADDGLRAYFTCAAPLPGVSGAAGGTITAAGGEPGTADASNLYLYDATMPVAQRWRFIARLPRQSVLGICATRSTGSGSVLALHSNGEDVDVVPQPNFLGPNCVRGTPDGAFVTFFTDGRLTGDDPDGASGDIYGYDLSDNELSRVTAPQGGDGGTYPCAPPNTVRCFGDGGIGSGRMPLPTLGVATRPNGDRLAFFGSRSRLVPQDADDEYDVYQWRAGELSLVSTGASATEGAMYAGNDRSGLNVYFATRDQLTWQDKDRVLDIYTARIGGGFPEPPAPPDCPVMAGGCHAGGPPPTPPAQVGSDRPVGDNVARGSRRALSLRRLTASQRRAAARTGKLVLHVRATHRGRVALTARSRISGRTRVVGRASKRLAKPGAARIELRLTLAARKALARGSRLRVTIRARLAGAAESRSMAVVLRRPGR